MNKHFLTYESPKCEVVSAGPVDLICSSFTAEGLTQDEETYQW